MGSRKAGKQCCSFKLMYFSKTCFCFDVFFLCLFVARFICAASEFFVCSVNMVLLCFVVCSLCFLFFSCF